MDTDHHLLIQKLLSGEISDNEKEKLDIWLERHPDNREFFEEIKLIWDNADLREIELDYDPQEELSAIQDKINKESIEKQKDQKLYPARSKRPGFLKIASLILLLICFNFLVWHFLFRPSSNYPIQVVNAGHYNSIVLPDSSRIYLNKNASLSFKQTSKKRETYLSGEAYFEVVKDQKKPFFVYLQNATIKVLGTSFNVKAYPSTKNTEVIVTSGLVEVFNDFDSIKLGQGEKTYFRQNEKHILRSINADPNFDSWKTGKLQFDNAEFASILDVLEAHYDISIEVTNDKVLTCRFTGTFKNDKLEKVLKVLSYGLDFSYQYLDGQYILSGGGCKKNN